LQPAFYEAFGLTVVEAMTCCLPTFATGHGGPNEKIEHEISGFLIDMATKLIPVVTIRTKLNLTSFFFRFNWVWIWVWVFSDFKTRVWDG